MSGVVLRCRNCGTTQATPGECEACHEGDVQYFCPNHSPGRWLDEPACSACGAMPGVPGRTERVPARPAPAPPPDFRGRRTSPPPGRPAPHDEDEFEREVLTGPVHSPGAEGRLLEELIRAGLAGGPRGAPALPPIGAGISTAFGCVRRIVVILFVLMVLAAMFVFGLLGATGPANPPDEIRESPAMLHEYRAPLAGSLAQGLVPEELHFAGQRRIGVSVH